MKEKAIPLSIEKVRGSNARAISSNMKELLIGKNLIRFYLILISNSLLLFIFKIKNKQFETLKNKN